MTDQKSTTSIPESKGALSLNHLVPGERILWEGRPALVVFALKPALLIILALTFLFMANAFVTSQSADAWSVEAVLFLVIALAICGVMIPIIRRTGWIIALSGIAAVVVMAIFPGQYDWLIFLPLAISLLNLLAYYIIWRHIAFALTDRRIISQYGIFTLRYADTQVGKVQNVTVIQPWYERMLGYGDVSFATSGEVGGIDYSRPGLRVSADGAMVWENIRKPFKVRKKVEEIIYPPVAKQINGQERTSIPGTVGMSAEERLSQVKKMRDSGLISEAEYQTKKNEILKGL